MEQRASLLQNSDFADQDAQKNPSPLAHSLWHSVVTDIANHAKTLEDFTVVVDGSVIRCSSIVLCACSEYFRGLLTTDMREKAKASVELPDISKPTFEAIYSMLTSNQIAVTKTNVIQVWVAADRLQCQSVVKLCENFLVTFLSSDLTDAPTDEPVNMYSKGDIYGIAVTLNSQKVIDTCLRVFKEKFDEFRLTLDFKNLGFEDVLALLESDELVVDEEYKVVEAVFAWVEHTPVQIERLSLNNECSNLPVGNECLSTNEETDNQSQVKEHESLECENKNNARKCSDETNEEGVDTLASDTEMVSENCRTNPDNDGIPNILEQEEESVTNRDAERNITRSDQNHSDNEDNRVTEDGHSQIVQKPNPRRLPHLADLLDVCCLCDLEPKSLNICLDKAATWQDMKAVRVLRKAINFFLFPKEWIGWPIMYRKCSKYHNVMVGQSEDKLFFYDCQSGNMSSQSGLLKANEVIVLRTRANSHRIIIAGPDETCDESDDDLVHNCHIQMNRLIRRNLATTAPNARSSSLLKKGDAFTRIPKQVLHNNIKRYHYWQCGKKEEHVIWINALVSPKEIEKWHLTGTSPCCKWSITNRRESIQDYAFYGDTLLMVSEDTLDDNKITRVYCKCIAAHKHNFTLDTIKGPGKDLVLFGDGPAAYVLQANGALWKIGRKKDPTTTFDLSKDIGWRGKLDLLFQTRMWQEVIDLCGAVVYKGTLILFVYFDPQSTSRPVIGATGPFKKTKIVALSEKVKFYPYALPRDMLSAGE